MLFVRNGAVTPAAGRRRRERGESQSSQIVVPLLRQLSVSLSPPPGSPGLRPTQQSGLDALIFCGSRRIFPFIMRKTGPGTQGLDLCPRHFQSINRSHNLVLEVAFIRVRDLQVALRCQVRFRGREIDFEDIVIGPTAEGRHILVSPYVHERVI